jgi:hypothetical protein
MKEKTKKLIKDPMVIGAAAGFVFSALLAAIIAGLQDAAWPAAEFLLTATYPVAAGVAALETVRLFGDVWHEYITTFTALLWYLQYGFFAGLFFRLLRKRFSGKWSALILAAAIIISCVIIYYSNIFLITSKGWRIFH